VGVVLEEELHVEQKFQQMAKGEPEEKEQGKAGAAERTFSLARTELVEGPEWPARLSDVRDIVP